MKTTFTTFILSISIFSNSITAQVNRANMKKSVPYKANYQRMTSGFSAGHTLEIRGGMLWGWGPNEFGQLGDGTQTGRTTPVRIGIDNKWVQVACGQGRSFGLKSDTF